MAEIKRTLILEVREGVGTPASIALEMGRTLDPMGVGTDGDWRVIARGVQELHAYLYFDGARLYAQSVTIEEPAFVEGSPLSEAWTEIVPPATIAIGKARVVYRALSEDFEDKTEIGPPPMTDREHTGTTSPAAISRAVNSGEEVTRIEPLRRHVTPPPPPREPMNTPVHEITGDEMPDSQAKTRINAPAYVPDAPAYAPDLPTLVSAQEPQVIVAPPTPRTAARGSGEVERADVEPPSTTPSPKKRAGEKKGIAEQWKELPTARKAMVVLLPLAIASVAVVLREEPAPEGKGASESAGGSGSGGGSGSAGASRVAVSPAPVVTTVVASAAPVVSALPPDADAAVSTAERAAADAVAAGEYSNAIRMYDQLAAAHPEQPVYREAARILRGKLDAGAN